MRKQSPFAMGITALNLIALLVGVLWTTPAAGIPPGKALCSILTLGACLLFNDGYEPFANETAPRDAQTVPVDCSKPVMTSAPTFLSAPKGSAKYPFNASCTSPARPGTMMVHWEGSWTPSETQQDRPNASESLTITGYEPFIPGRQAGGKIFMYWTARCTADPWLQGGTCHRFGGYVPDDLREAFPQMDSLPFPRTANQISDSLKQKLISQYQAANPRSAQMTQQSVQNMMVQSQQPQTMTPSQRAQSMVGQPQAVPNMGISGLSRSRVFARGVEEKEEQPSGQQNTEAPPESVETSDTAAFEEGTPEIAEPVVLTLEHPFHATNAKGDAVELKPGVYEIGAVMDIQLGVAKEGQPTVLLNAKRDTHSIPIRRTIAAMIPGPSDDLHLLFLTPDGRRFNAVGYASEVKSRSTDMVTSLPDNTIKDVIEASSVRPRSLSSPPCQPNPADIGPRWIPVPCTIATGPASTTTP